MDFLRDLNTTTNNPTTSDTSRRAFKRELESDEEEEDDDGLWIINNITRPQPQTASNEDQLSTIDSKLVNVNRNSNYSLSDSKR